jgi:hypothetical protein
MYEKQILFNALIETNITFMCMKKLSLKNDMKHIRNF